MVEFLQSTAWRKIFFVETNGTDEKHMRRVPFGALSPAYVNNPKWGTPNPKKFGFQK